MRRGFCGWSDLRNESGETGLKRIGLGSGAAVAAAIAAILIFDQWTKSFARARWLTPGQYLGGHLTLVHTENSGAFLSLGADLPPLARTLIFSGFVTLILAALIVSLVTGSIRRSSDVVASLMIIAGGIGNLIDRILRDGRVTDFIYLEAGPLHTGIFNVADITITLGVTWLFLSSMVPRKTR
jgi:signal peptidase II